jgi:molecular chaperone HscB
MTIFELYNIPLSFTPDQTAVKKIFYTLSKKYHPDFAGDSTEEEKQVLLEKSAMVNKALKIFQDQELLIKYILQEKGLLEEEEKYNLDPSFLMEVMELNEQVMELEEKDTDDERNVLKESIKSALQNLQEEIYEPVKPLLANYSETTGTEKELLQIKDYYFKQKYIDRMKRELAV